MSFVLKKIHRNKRGRRFRFTAAFRQLQLECSCRRPDNISISWKHRRRSVESKPYKWESSLTDAGKGIIVFQRSSHEIVEVETTLYESAGGGYEDKEWSFVIEEVGNGRKRPLASVPLNLAMFVSDPPGTLTELKLKLKPLKRYIELCILDVVLSFFDLNSCDDDVQSISSLLSQSLYRDSNEQFHYSSSSIHNESAVDPITDEVADLTRDFEQSQKRFEQESSLQDDHCLEIPAKSLEPARVHLPEVPMSNVSKPTGTYEVHGPMAQVSSPLLNSGVDRAVNKSENEDLLTWCQNVTNDYRNVSVTNFGSSWRNGLAFAAIIHHYRPDLIDYYALSAYNVRENCSTAFNAAQSLGIPKLIDPDDMVVMSIPDKISVMRYVHSLRSYFCKHVFNDYADTNDDSQFNNYGNCDQSLSAELDRYRPKRESMFVLDALKPSLFPSTAVPANYLNDLTPEKEFESFSYNDCDITVSKFLDISPRHAVNSSVRSETDPSLPNANDNSMSRQPIAIPYPSFASNVDIERHDRKTAESSTRSSPEADSPFSRLKKLGGSIRTTDFSAMASRLAKTALLSSQDVSTNEQSSKNAQSEGVSGGDLKSIAVKLADKELPDYKTIDSELAELASVETRLEKRKQSVERKLRSSVENESPDYDQLLTEQQKIVTRKDSVTQRQHYLLLVSLKEQEDLHLLKVADLARLLKVDEADKTESTQGQIQKYMGEICELVNKKDQLWQQLLCAEEKL